MSVQAAILLIAGCTWERRGVKESARLDCAARQWLVWLHDGATNGYSLSEGGNTRNQHGTTIACVCVCVCSGIPMETNYNNNNTICSTISIRDGNELYLQGIERQHTHAHKLTIESMQSTMNVCKKMKSFRKCNAGRRFKWFTTPDIKKSVFC